MAADLYAVAIQVEALLRDDLELVGPRFCELCMEEAPRDSDGTLLADVPHARTCPYRQLSEALTQASQFRKAS